MPVRPAPQPAPTLIGLAPVVDARTRIVILGSFPGGRSLAAGQYYAHPQNGFWPIVGEVIGVPLAALPYAERLEALLAHGLGLWDVLQACDREGSLDSAIRNAAPNDFARLLREAPSLVRACHNGKTSGRWAPALAALGLDARVLPSTSPANAAWSRARKLAAWREALAMPPAA